MRHARLLGLPLTLVPDTATALAALLPEPGRGSGPLVTFVNPRAWALARAEPDYAALLERFDLVLPDGIGVAWAARRLFGPPVARLSFDASSLYRPVFRALDARRARVAVVGAAPGVAARAAARMRAEFPGVRFVAVRDGYGGLAATAAAVAAAEPELVLGGMGAPRQERFLLTLRAAGWRGAGITCGGFLDQLAARPGDYYPAWVDRLELRWAWRLAMEPRRLGARYLVEYRPFVRRALAEVLAARRRTGAPARPAPGPAGEAAP